MKEWVYNEYTLLDESELKINEIENQRLILKKLPLVNGERIFEYRQWYFGKLLFYNLIWRYVMLFAIFGAMVIAWIAITQLQDHLQTPHVTINIVLLRFSVGALFRLFFVLFLFFLFYYVSKQYFVRRHNVMDVTKTLCNTHTHTHAHEKVCTKKTNTQIHPKTLRTCMNKYNKIKGFSLFCILCVG